MTACQSLSGSAAWEHTIRDENDFERHVDYINPVKPAWCRGSGIGRIRRSIV